MPTINDKLYREIRCPNCRRLLGYEYVFAGRLAFYCNRCGELTEMEFKHMQTKENKDTIKDEFTVGNNNNQSTVNPKEGGE